MDARDFIVPSRIVGALFLVPALLTAGFAAWLYLGTSRFVRTATPVSATVVELAETKDSDRSTMYAPVLEYRDAAGAAHRFTSAVRSNPPGYTVGDSVPVLYETGNPANGRMAGFFYLWLGSLITAFVAAGALLMALVFLLLIPFTIRRVSPRREQGTA